MTVVGSRARGDERARRVDDGGVHAVAGFDDAAARGDDVERERAAWPEDNHRARSQRARRRLLVAFLQPEDEDLDQPLRVLARILAARRRGSR